MKKDSLSQLKPGESALVVDIRGGGRMRRRLCDIGLIAGTKVTCARVSPWGDPTAYIIRGAVMALRAEDSSRVRIDAAYGLPSQNKL